MQTNSIMQIINSFAPILIITFIFIFFIFRPQYKKANEHKKMLAALKTGDRIITNAGLIGTIEKIDGEIIHLMISEQVIIQILKNAVIEIYDEKKFLSK